MIMSAPVRGRAWKETGWYPRSSMGHTAVSILAGVGGLVLAAACGALVVEPEAFSLRDAPSCDGPCPADAALADKDASPVGPDPRAPWPMVGANAAHTGRVAINGSTLSGKSARWKLKPGGTPSAGPAVDGDGTAYLTTTAGMLISVALDGTIRWSHMLGAASRCTPALGNGAVYATATTGLAAFTNDGVKQWTVGVGGASSPVIGADGTIYVTDVAGVHAVSPEGAVKWTYAAPGGTDLRGDAVALDDDGVIYAVRNGLHAISPNGAALWVAPQGDLLAPAPVIANDRIYVGSAMDLVALRVGDHAVAWKRPVTSRLRASPAVDRDGLVYYFSGAVLEWVSGADGLGNLPLNDLAITRPFQAAIDGRNVAYLATRKDVDASLVTTFKGTREGAETFTLSFGDLEPIGFAIGKDGTVFVAAASPTNAEPGYVIAIAP